MRRSLIKFKNFVGQIPSWAGRSTENPHRDFVGFPLILKILIGIFQWGLYHWLVSLETNQPYLKKKQLQKILRPKNWPTNQATMPQFYQAKMATNLVGLWCIVHDGSLLMLLANFLIQSRAWSKCELRVYVVARSMIKWKL